MIADFVLSEVGIERKSSIPVVVKIDGRPTLITHHNILTNLIFFSNVGFKTVLIEQSGATQMSIHSSLVVSKEIDNGEDFLGSYLNSLSMVERLHRLLLDVIKDEFERLGFLDINSVQALLLFNIGENEVTAGELKSRGYYQGSNVSYNLKKLVESGYMHHQKCEIDRRAVRVKLTPDGRKICEVVRELFERHATSIAERSILGDSKLEEINAALQKLERYWTDQIRYIY